MFLFACLLKFTLTEIIHLFISWDCITKIIPSFAISWQGCSFCFCSFLALDFQQMKMNICLLMVSMGHINWLFAVQLIQYVMFYFIPTQIKEGNLFAPVAEVTDICFV